MGCGIKLKANKGDERPQPDQAVQVFFTRNGQEVRHEGVVGGWVDGEILSQV